MSTTPPGATLVPGAQPFGPAMAARYRDRGGLVPPGVAAEAFGFGREALDAYALRSHEKAVAAAPDPGLVPVGSVKADELPRPDVTAAELAEARPAFTPDGVVTALNSAAMADGAAAVVVVSEAVAAGKQPLARIAGVAEVGVDPLAMLTGAVPATQRVLLRAGVGIEAVERFEIGEPFAAVPLAWQAALGVDGERVNIAGGGIALGEPTGATGARLVVTLAHGLGGWGVATTVSSGGLGAAVLLASE
jgi:acetyl-CoA acyltransferase